MKRLLLSLLLAAQAQAEPDATEVLVPWLLEQQESLREIPFSTVIAATSGKKILPIKPSDPADAALLKEIGRCLDEAMLRLNEPNVSFAKEERINEVSSHVENAMRERLDASPLLACDYPKTAAGNVQRSGYPDLRVVEEATGRILYLDPKLYAAGSQRSTFRTFYFEPKSDTNKVRDDAVHLIVGIEHEPRPGGGWNLKHWQLVDLSTFKVRLKAEFEGSNRNLYRPGAVVGQSAR